MKALDHNEERKLRAAFTAIVDPEREEIHVGGQSVVLINRGALAEVQKDLETVLGRGVESVLVHAGYRQGRAVTARLSALVGSDDAAFVQGLGAFASQTGMMHLDEATVEGDQAIFRIHHSLIGEAYGKSERPVCHYVRGFLIAGAERLLRQSELLCREVRCCAMGEQGCEFHVTPILAGRRSPP